jgi:hypothetical protein
LLPVSCLSPLLFLFFCLCVDSSNPLHCRSFTLSNLRSLFTSADQQSLSTGNVHSWSRSCAITTRVNILFCPICLTMIFSRILPVRGFWIPSY